MNERTEELAKQAAEYAIEFATQDQEQYIPKLMEKFAELVAAHEREECANIAHQWSKREDDVGGYIEAAIRARSGA